jgi:hypothetical protein
VKQTAALAANDDEGLAISRIMRNGQNKRMRGRNRKGGGHHQNPLSRMYESNGPDVKIRGTASHIAEKYLQLARDAQSSGDPISAENYYQHAEHYFRMIAAAQEQFRQTQPYYQQHQQHADTRSASGEEMYEDGDGDAQPAMGGEPFAPPQQQSFYPREQQPYPTREPQPFGPREPQHQQARTQPSPAASEEDIERLPSFITGGSQQQSPQQSHGPNGFDSQPDRFPLHRRRRRHRGPRDHALPGDGDAPAPSGPRPAED